MSFKNSCKKFFNSLNIFKQEQPKYSIMGKVCICIGHSSKDEGARNDKYNVGEYSFNKELANKIKEELDKLNYTSYIVNRLTDGGGTGMSADIRAVNKHEVDCIIELHCNAYNGKASGCETLYWHTSKKGKRLAELVQEKTLAVLENNDRKIKPIDNGDRGAAVLKGSYYPMIMTEPFFIDNDNEYINARLNMDKLAKNIALAIDEWFRTLI